MGTVVSIHIAPESAAPTVAVQSVTAVAGCGLVGDRNYHPEGPESPDYDPTEDATLIEIEAIEAVTRDYEIPLEPGETRRQIVTRGIALNHLVGQRFQVGEVLLLGRELCEPCGHLEKLTRAGVRKALVHRGGLRAQLLTGGEIRVGDRVRVL